VAGFVEAACLYSVASIMPRLSLDARRRAVEYWQSGYSVADIKDRFKEEKVSISKRSLERLMKKYLQYGTLLDLPRRARTKKLTQEMVMFMNSELEKNDEMTAPRLRNKLTEKWPSLQVMGGLST